MQDEVAEPGAFGGFRAMEQDDDIDPIPASVHPRDQDDDDDGEGGPGFLSGIKWGPIFKMLLGVAIGMALLAGVTFGLAKANMLPGFMAGIAAKMGVAPPSKSAGLALADISARAANGMTVVTGKVNNTSDHEITLPAIEITPVDADGTEAEGKRITLPQETLKAGENMTFGAELQGVLEADGSLRVEFVE